MNLTLRELYEGAGACDLIAALVAKLPDIQFEVARQKEYAELGDSGYDPCRQRQKEIDHLIGGLKQARKELEALRNHVHEWSRETDYCIICGADGRA